MRERPQPSRAEPSYLDPGFGGGRQYADALQRPVAALSWQEGQGHRGRTPRVPGPIGGRVSKDVNGNCPALS